VAAFAPWNFPIGNPGRKLGAPIAAGCSVILKAAEEAPGSALAVLQCLLDAGLPKEVGQAVFGVPDEVSRHLLGSPIIRKLSFTGSTVVGKHLMKLAAEDCKRTTMELGGHGAVLVFEDVDVEQVLNTMVGSKFRNAGQVCISPTRFIVHEEVYERFLSGFTARAAQWRVGNGLEEGVQMGPMANPRRPEAMERLIGGAVQAGARLHTGGKRLGGPGYYYAPTVLSAVPSSAAIMNEEPFGPVALIAPLQLPNGVTVTQIQCAITDNVTDSPTIFLGQKLLTGSGPSLPISVQSTTNSASIQTVTASGSVTINNSTLMYMLGMRFCDVDATCVTSPNNCKLYGCSVTYTQSTLLP